jgi:hypothetical protein
VIPPPAKAGIHRPIGTLTTPDRWDVIDGSGMLMLRVPKVRAAMGFRARYALPVNHKEALRVFGNAVCPPVAANLLGAISMGAIHKAPARVDFIEPPTRNRAQRSAVPLGEKYSFAVLSLR